MIRAYFVSDIHLKTMHERNSQLLLRFFHSLATNESSATPRPTHVFLVGDIFDLWISSHRYFVDRFAPLVAAIRELITAGIEVHFFEGNHDLYLKEFWQDELGVHVHADAAYFNLDGTIVRVEHGDLINPDDNGYLFLRAALRTAPLRFLARHLPASAVNAIGERASRASRQYTSTAKGLADERSIALIRAHARRAYQEKPFDLLITGHVHVRDDYGFSMDGRSVRSVNLGSWFDGARFFAWADTDGETGFHELN